MEVNQPHGPRCLLANPNGHSLVEKTVVWGRGGSRLKSHHLDVEGMLVSSSAAHPPAPALGLGGWLGELSPETLKCGEKGIFFSPKELLKKTFNSKMIIHSQVIAEIAQRGLVSDFIQFLLMVIFPRHRILHRNKKG